MARPSSLELNSCLDLVGHLFGTSFGVYRSGRLRPTNVKRNAKRIKSHFIKKQSTEWS